MECFPLCLLFSLGEVPVLFSLVPFSAIVLVILHRRMLWLNSIARTQLLHSFSICFSTQTEQWVIVAPYICFMSDSPPPCHRLVNETFFDRKKTFHCLSVWSPLVTGSNIDPLIFHSFCLSFSLMRLWRSRSIVIWLNFKQFDINDFFIQCDLPPVWSALVSYGIFFMVVYSLG